MQRLGVRFDVNRVDSASYGVECWKIFFQAIDPVAIAPALLFEGDSAASCAGLENVFIIAIEAAAPALESIKSLIAKSPQFQQTCAAPMFVEGRAASIEPLPLAGQLAYDGSLVGDAWNARPGLNARLRNTGA